MRACVRPSIALFLKDSRSSTLVERQRDQSFVNATTRRFSMIRESSPKYINLLLTNDNRSKIIYSWPLTKHPREDQLEYPLGNLLLLFFFSLLFTKRHPCRTCYWLKQASGRTLSNAIRFVRGNFTLDRNVVFITSIEINSTFDTL